MRKIVSCEFNMDTACVELCLEDGSTAPLWKTKWQTVCTSGRSWTGCPTTIRWSMPS